VIASGVLTAVSIMIGLTAVALAVLVAGTKALRTRRRRSLAVAVAPHRWALLAVASGEDDDASGAAHLIAVAGGDWRSLAPDVITMLSKIRGGPAEDLVDVLRRQGDIERAVTFLRSHSTVRRARAAHLLGLVHDVTHVPDLVPLLSDRSREVRLVAVRALGAIGDPSAANDILLALRTTRRQVPVPAHVAAEALLAMGVGTGPALREALNSEDPLVRDVAAVVAGHINLLSAAPGLQELLHGDPDPQVRISAVRALELVGGAADVARVAAVTSDGAGPAPLRRACAAALGGLGHPDAAQPLAALLGDPDRRLAQIAAESLTLLGATGVEQLMRASPATPAGRAARAALAATRLRSITAADE